MSGAFTSAGSKISVSANLPATYTKDGFESLTFSEVKEVVDLGEFGRQYNLVTHNPLSDRRTVKRKGSYNDGSVTVQMARVPSDAGQTILLAAVDSDASISVKVELQDDSVMYFSAQAMGYPTSVGTVDQITSASVVLEIDNDIIPG